ncbi:hypothetical protein B566_EDAN012334 [Ephemera danica]|nr:hypothetical protein B566_EDAN012334 [Ephemera danica]
MSASAATDGSLGHTEAAEMDQNAVPGSTSHNHGKWFRGQRRTRGLNESQVLHNNGLDSIMWTSMIQRVHEPPNSQRNFTRKSLQIAGFQHLFPPQLKLAITFKSRR